MKSEIRETEGGPALASAPLLRCIDVEKSYAGGPQGNVTKAVSGLSFDIAEQEFFCLLGPTNCGKTTVLDMLAGFEMPTSGEIFIAGSKVTGPSRDRAVVFQGDNSLFEWLTAAENVEFGPRMSGIETAKRRETARHYVELVGLGRHSQKYPREMSGGMKQRVQIARVLANEPRMLLMDEPFAALDAQTRRVMQKELVRIWRATRKTIFFITHDIDEALILGTKVGVMRSGPASNIKEIIDIDTDLPRERTDSSFIALFNTLYRSIETEVSKTLQAQDDLEQ